MYKISYVENAQRVKVVRINHRRAIQDKRLRHGVFKIQNWSKMDMDREAWKRIVEQAKGHRAVAPREEEEGRKMA
jgi:hypothetical protein